MLLEKLFKIYGTSFSIPKSRWRSSHQLSLVSSLRISPLTSDIYTDASLASHEYEVKRLESLVNARQTVLSLVKRHIELVAEKQHLEESSKDPSRLTQRGAQAAGRLLQEEKVRKKLSKELPKVPSRYQNILIM
jgi:Ase1/PRC1/MAP65 family protein